MTKKRELAYLALIGNVFLWGLAIPIVKKGFAAGLTPPIFLLGRYLVAALVSLPIILIIRRQTQVKKVFRRENLTRVICLELLGTVLALWLLYEGVARTSAVEASLIAVTWPVFVTIGGVIFLREKEERHELLGLLIALAGTTVLVVRPLLNGGGGGNFLGNLLIIGQNIVIAGYLLLAKRNYRGLNKWAITHVSFWLGLVSFGLIALVTSPGATISMQLLTFDSLWPILAIVYMGIAGSILGLTLYLYGQDKIEASEAAVFTYLQPAVAIPASILLLGESLSFIEVLGVAIVALGVYVTQRRK